MPEVQSSKWFPNSLCSDSVMIKRIGPRYRTLWTCQKQGVGKEERFWVFSITKKKKKGELLHFLGLIAWHCRKGEAVNWQSSNTHRGLVPFWSSEIPWPEGVGGHLQQQNCLCHNVYVLTSLNHAFPPPAFYFFRLIHTSYFMLIIKRICSFQLKQYLVAQCQSLKKISRSWDSR